MSEKDARLDLEFVYHALCDLIETIDGHKNTREESDATLIKRIRAKLDLVARAVETRNAIFLASNTEQRKIAKKHLTTPRWKLRCMSMMRRLEEFIATSDNLCVKYGDDARRGYRKGMNDTLIMLIGIFTGDKSPELRDLPPELEMVREFRDGVTAMYDKSLLALRGKGDCRNTLSSIFCRCRGLLADLDKFKDFLPRLQSFLYD